MAHARFVKSARKDYPDHGIKKGESYYWWSFRSPRGGGSGRYFSKTPPKASQLTRSEFKSTLCSIEESLHGLAATGYEDVSSLQTDLDNIKDELESLKSDTEDKLNNMPEGLQQGDTGQLLQTRIDELDTLIGEFDGVDFEEPEEDATKPQKGETKKAALQRAVDERVEEILREVGSYNWGID